MNTTDTKQIEELDTEGEGELDLSLLIRYYLQLPLPNGMTHAQLDELVRKNSHADEILDKVCEDFRSLKTLRLGWRGYYGALRAALKGGRVSRDELQQRAWENTIQEDPALATRVQQVGNIALWLRSLLSPRPLSYALAGMSVLAVFGWFRPISKMPPNFPSDRTKDMQRGTETRNELSPHFSSEGSKDIERIARTTNQPTSGIDPDTVKKGEWLTNPPDGALFRAIRTWQVIANEQPQNLIAQDVLRRLYDRALQTPQSRTLIDDTTRQAIQRERSKYH